MNKWKLWIARNPDTYEDDDEDYCHPIKGELILFYDTPLRGEKDGKPCWTYAREMAKLPSYMYPEITWEHGPMLFESKPYITYDN